MYSYNRDAYDLNLEALKHKPKNEWIFCIVSIKLWSKTAINKISKSVPEGNDTLVYIPMLKNNHGRRRLWSSLCFCYQNPQIQTVVGLIYCFPPGLNSAPWRSISQANILPSLSGSVLITLLYVSVNWDIIKRSRLISWRRDMSRADVADTGEL